MNSDLMVFSIYVLGLAFGLYWVQTYTKSSGEFPDRFTYFMIVMFWPIFVFLTILIFILQ